MKKFLVIFITVMTLCFAAVQVMALPVAIGEPQIIGSWAQQFNETGVGPFNKLEGFMSNDPPIAFEAPGFANFSSGGWTGSLINARYIKATGPDNSNLNFNIDFLPSSNVPLAFYFLAWNGGANPIDFALASWDGVGWNFTPIGNDHYSLFSFDRTPATSVPEPATMLLLGIGIIGIASLRKKKFAF